jgi:hypothetical protein
MAEDLSEGLPIEQKGKCLCCFNKLKPTSEKTAHALYSTILKRVERILGDGVTYGSDLDKLGKEILGRQFTGVFPSDRCPAMGTRNKYAIINLDDSSGGGTHWVACAFSNGKVMLYDSFGRAATDILPSLSLKNLVPVVNTDDDAEQLALENNCGARSLSWLIFHAIYGHKQARLI